MVVILIIWCTITVTCARPSSAFAQPAASVGVRPLQRKESLGWLRNLVQPHHLDHDARRLRPLRAGHERRGTLAQVNREIEHPKLKNLEKTGLVIFIYSLLFTSLVSFFAVMIIPDKVRPDYFANLIGGIAMYSGAHSLKLVFHGFVVMVGVLILAGAQNTAIVGANGVLNRVAKTACSPVGSRSRTTASAPATASST
jgi:hypothetical protein